MSEAFETRCHVWDVDQQNPEDDLFPCATFLINIQAKFTTAASYDEDEPCFMELETDSVVLEQTLDVRREHLMYNNCDVSSGSARIRDRLLSMNIPVQDFMVEQILACAYRMGMTERYRNRKVLRMRVEIEAVVDELPNDDDDEDDDEGDEHSDSLMNGNESETATVIEKLQEIVVERPDNCCPICLEDFLVGSEATSLPVCSHVFHPRCIIPWLYRKNLCPVCRSVLNSEYDPTL